MRAQDHRDGEDVLAMRHRGDTQGVGGPAVEAHLGGEIGPLEQGHVGDEQTRHALALAIGGMRIVP